MSKTNQVTINRKFKDRLFRILFSEKKYALELYNGLNHTNYQDENEIEITTLDDVIYMRMHNDISFLINNFMNFYEHQSTKNPNMPFRGFLYLADSYKEWAESKDVNIYSSKLIKIPTPKFVVLYNGSTDMEEEEYLKLSDAFEHKEDIPTLELVVHVINVNYGHNQDLMSRCKVLNEYSYFVSKTREYAKAMKFEEAVETAINTCIEEGILEEFLRRRRADVMSAILTEYDEEKVLAKLANEYLHEGIEQGIKNLIEDNLEENIPVERIVTKLIKRYQLSEEEARRKIEQYKEEE